MPQVSFYILSEHHKREQFLCQLTNKIWQKGHEIHIHTNHREQATQLNDRLWTYSDISFLPHRLQGTEGTAPITIGWQEQDDHKNDVLINLHESIPAFVEDFQRIVEIIPCDEALKIKGREHFRHYRQCGYELENHSIE